VFNGGSAGGSNTIGGSNLFTGYGSGFRNTTGSGNVFAGPLSGSYNTTGLFNVFIGYQSGYNVVAGSANVFIGYKAGYNELGSNKLYIANSDTATPLIYGDFATKEVSIHGNVGIGTTSPSNKLHIEGSSGIRVSGDASNQIFLEGVRNDSGTNFRLYDNNNDIYYDSRSNMTFRANQLGGSGGSINLTGGNVGIGTTTPSEKLEIYDTTNTPGVISLKSSRNDAGHVDVGRVSAKQASIEVARIGMPRAHQTNSGYLTFWTKKDNATNLVESMRINENGNVGIGTTNPPADFKLAVAGKIISEEVKIQLQANWPDYVFAKEYKLPSLKEVETHIAKNGHLENIPSAKEVAKNGIFLGEMDSKLLQKIEELTLYTIQQQKRIDVLETQKAHIHELKEENKTLADRLAKIEKMLTK
jgi:general stress protein 26